MQYTSTRNNTVRVDSATAIARGISPDGGLYVPCEIPTITAGEFSSAAADYRDLAADILGRFLTDYKTETVKECVYSAYTDKFSGGHPAPCVKLKDNEYILELWHGPTCAFKDMALQLLPYLLTNAVTICGEDKEIIILVATSGDTGKAALEGFADVPGTKIIVFYPSDGVSRIQKLQMTTQSGANVNVCAVRGNFDDTQTGVKKIFTDDGMKSALAENGMAFSSANSINWGRLAPQIVYYISAYLDIMNTRGGEFDGKPINIVVPTGNFGNILAAYYAKLMGLPVNKLICASNANDVLTEFLRTGVYDRNRPFHTTISPSMDILISSNLERLLYHLSGCDSERVSGWMKQLSETGRYEVDEDIKAQLRELFWAGSCDDNGTQVQIKKTFDEHHYLADTHTAVALDVYEQYLAQTGDNTPAVIASTASPFKFSGSVLEALAGDCSELEEFDMIDKLSEISGQPVPAPLAGLKTREVRFDKVCSRDELADAVNSALGIK